MHKLRHISFIQTLAVLGRVLPVIHMLEARPPYVWSFRFRLSFIMSSLREKNDVLQLKIQHRRESWHSSGEVWLRQHQTAFAVSGLEVFHLRPVWRCFFHLSFHRDIIRGLNTALWKPFRYTCSSMVIPKSVGDIH